MHVNLLIDYLRYIWDKTSSVIHVNDKSFPYQKEIFHGYLKETLKISKKITDNNTISVKNSVNILLENKE